MRIFTALSVAVSLLVSTPAAAQEAEQALRELNLQQTQLHQEYLPQSIEANLGHLLLQIVTDEREDSEWPAHARLAMEICDQRDQLAYAGALPPINYDRSLLQEERNVFQQYCPIVRRIALDPAE